MSFGVYEEILTADAEGEFFFGTPGEFNGGEIIVTFFIAPLTVPSAIPMRDPDSSYEIEIHYNGVAIARTNYTLQATHNHVENGQVYDRWLFDDLGVSGIPQLFSGYILPEIGEMTLSYLFTPFPAGEMTIVYQGTPPSIWTPEVPSNPSTSFAAAENSVTLARCDWDLTEDSPTGRGHRIMDAQEQCISDYDSEYGLKINQMGSGTQWSAPA